MPIAAKPAGMDSMQYYVGTWNCVGTQTGQPSSKAVVTYTLDSGLMRSWVDVAPQGKMKTPYLQSSATSYDSKNGRYVSTSLDNQNQWSVSYAKPFTGMTESWADHANSTGKLGRGSVTRNSQDTFTYLSYPAMTGAYNFKAVCHRGS